MYSIMSSINQLVNAITYNSETMEKPIDQPKKVVVMKTVIPKVEPIPEPPVVEQNNENDEPVFEKVTGEVVTPDQIPGYKEVFEKTMSFLSAKNDITSLMDPETEPNPNDYTGMKSRTVLENGQVSDLIHRVNVAVHPETEDQSRNINFVTLVILYGTKSIDPELLFAVCRNESDMITVNSINRFFTGISVFSQYACDRPIIGIADKDEMFSIISTVYSFFKEVERTTDFICEVDIYTILEDLMQRNIKHNGKRIEQDKTPKLEEVEPINIILPEIGSPEIHTPTKQVLKEIKTELSKISGGVKCEVVPNGDLVYATLFMKKQMQSYYIDPNVIIGNGYNMFCNAPVPNQTIFVNFKHKDIIKKAIENPAYVPSTEEIMRVQNDMFLNQSIYYRIDMSNMSKISSKLSEEDMSLLGKKLSAISTIDFGGLDLPEDPRLRIKTFTDINNFTLVSDAKTYSPMLDRKLTASQIVFGLEIKVDHDDLYLYYPGKDNRLREIQFVINYGVM